MPPPRIRNWPIGLLTKSITAPAVTARHAAMIKNRHTTRATGTDGTIFLICSPHMLEDYPPNRLHTSAARLTALFRLIHSVSVRMAPSNPSSPMAARPTQLTVCCEVGAGAGAPETHHRGGGWRGGGLYSAGGGNRDPGGGPYPGGGGC